MNIKMDQTTMAIFSLAIVGLTMYYYLQYQSYNKEQANKTWPENIADCPDYWVNEGNGNCRNTHNIGKCPKDSKGKRVNQGVMNFDSATYKGDQGAVNKCRWAKKCHVSWEGVDQNCA
tara:strand:- start:7339 stop:7692 length:354 start_codon:yes stop_codon:yes gene_type:complete